MFCKNCGCEMQNGDNFCENCGFDFNAEKHDLHGVTKIPTPLFFLFSFLTLGIYPWVKWYRITGDIRKIVPRDKTVSPVIITSSILLSFCSLCCQFISEVTTIGLSIVDSIEETKLLDLMYGLQGLVLIAYFLIGIVILLVYCHMVYRTLRNIKKIAEIKQNKNLEYNKFWAFVFGILYINFVINTYDERLI